MKLAIARQMLGAELLKLRRNRTTMVVSLLLSVGVVVLVYGFKAIQHASNPVQYGPAGGLGGYSDGVRALGVFFGQLVAALIGTEAGTADIGSGVFRDLVATGRSRLSLFWVRLPGAILITWAFSLAGLALATVASFIFSGGLATPSVSLILESAGWIMLCTSVVAALAVGVGSLTGSRGATLTAVIGWQTVATQLLLHTQSLGSARDWLLTASFGQLMPVGGELAGISMATGIAIAVLLAWTVVPAAVGSWRTVTSDA